MRELRPGLWHWQAPHPDRSSDEPWPQEVSSYALDDGERLLLFDPLAIPDELLALAAEREPVAVLTCAWHERDTRSLVEPLGAIVHAPPADTAREHNDLVLWLDPVNAVLSGDTLVDFSRGFVELALPTHGEPTDRAALERALS